MASSWITEGEYENDGVFQLYTTAVYFTIQTLTTVGYGDFSIKSDSEKLITILLQLLGIIFFSFVSGAIINIIHDLDVLNMKNQEKMNTLRYLYGKYPMPADLYHALLAQIKNVDDYQMFKENNEFLDSLPYRLKLVTTKFLYRCHQEKVRFLKQQNENFIVWICPLLKQEFILQEQYLYQQTD